MLRSSLTFFINLRADLDKLGTSFLKKFGGPNGISIATTLEETLSLLQGQSAAKEALPPMPTDPSALREWHMETLRLRHASIEDALSGRLLNTLEDCVPIAMEGNDPSGKPLPIRHVMELSRWLRPPLHIP